MASIKISALGELELDRLSDTDVFIINDQDTTTQKITFETLRQGLDRDARYFIGPVEFANTVVFNGPLAGRNVYTKDETLSEINIALAPVKTDVTNLTIQQVKFADNLGTEASIYSTDKLEGSVLNAGPKNVLGSLNALSLAHDAHGDRIDSAETGISDNTAAIAVEKTRNDGQDTKILDLESAVGLPAGNNIGANTNLITGNTDNITSLASVIGVGLGEDTIAIGTLTGGIIESGGVPYTVIGALGKLEAAQVSTTADIVTLTGELTTNGTKTQENRDAVNTFRAAFLAALASYTPTNDTASELAAHLDTELSANTAILA